jgi:hypothetical protein
MLAKYGKRLAMVSLAIIVALQVYLMVGRAPGTTRKIVPETTPPSHENSIQATPQPPTTTDTIQTPAPVVPMIPAMSVKPLLDKIERVPGGKVREECESLKLRLGYSDAAKDKMRDLRCVKRGCIGHDCMYEISLCIAYLYLQAYHDHESNAARDLRCVFSKMQCIIRIGYNMT